MHCGDLDGKEVQKGRSICICMADSLHSNYTPIKINSILKAKGLHGDSETPCPLSQLPLRTHFFLSLFLK